MHYAAKRKSSQPGSWAACLLGTFAVLAPQLLGGATESSELAIIAGGAAVALCCAWAFRSSTMLGSTPLAAVAMLGAAVWTLIQALPVPCAWTEWAQPERTTIKAQLLELGVLESPSCTLSLAPGATWTALSLAVTLTALLMSATAAARSGHRRILLVAIALSSVAMACVALGHAVVDAHSVFGLYTPLHARPQFLLAPLMNENHLAGLLALGFPLCLSLAHTSERMDARVAWWTAGFITFASGLLSLSRGGAGALVAGGLAYLLIELRRQRSGASMRATIAVVIAMMACMALGTYFAVDLLAKQFTPADSPLNKIRVALKLAEFVQQHPWAGIGRGAMGDVSARLILRNQRLLFAENIIVQWVLEWGIPAALLIAAAFGGSLVKLRLEKRAERALACGLLALVAQNLVDFSLELAGVASVAAIALGVLVACEAPGQGRIWPLERLRARSVLLASAVAASLCAALAAPWLTRWSRSSLEEEISGKISQFQPPDAVTPLIRKGLAGYPLDSMFLVLGAALAVRDNDPTAPRWLNIAFEAAPGWAGPHLQAASYLERNGRFGQAAIEFGLAVELSPSQSGAACAFVKRHASAELVWAITPPGAANEQRLREAMADCLLQERLWAEGEKALLQLLERFPSSEYAHRRLVMTAGNLGHPDLAMSRAWAMFQSLPKSSASVANLAEMLTVQGSPQEALRIIDTSSKTVRDSQEVLLAEATAAARMHDERRLEDALNRVLARFGTTTRTRGGLLLFASQQLTTVGNHLAALTRARTAYELLGDPSALEIAHQAALRAGLLSAALRTAAELCNVGYRGKSFCGQRTPRETSAP
jgi:tetratricopeptide (TPR) repeat protein